MTDHADTTEPPNLDGAYNVDDAQAEIEQLRAERQQAIDALRAFFAEFDSENGQYAPSDETEAMMRAALVSLGEQK